MNDRNDIPGAGDDDALASEYVLGVLDEAERRACERRIASDTAFASLVSAWETRLSGLNEAYEEVSPPAAVRRAIEERLFGAEDNGGLTANLSMAMRRKLAFWRVLSVVSLATLALLAVIAIGPFGDGTAVGPRLVASLGADDTDARFVAVLEGGDNLAVTLINGDKPADRDFELWMIIGDETPISLGVVREGEELDAPGELTARLTEGVTLAVTLEPLGGSPIPGPTGPLVAAGVLKKI